MIILFPFLLLILVARGYSLLLLGVDARLKSLHVANVRMTALCTTPRTSGYFASLRPRRDTRTCVSTMKAGKDAALFDLRNESPVEWGYFGAAVSSILGAEYFVWLHPGGPLLAKRLMATIEQITVGDTTTTFALIFCLFAVSHSGLAALRPLASKLMGERVWRYVFASVSLPLAGICLSYFINHRYDGSVLWNLHGNAAAHAAMWWTSLVSFFFLYPSTFNLLEIAAVRKPDVHLWDTGITRITRHPQMVGQLLWCAAHTAYVGSSFMCVASALLCGYHLFATWHGDQRLRQRFGAEGEAYLQRTSIVPFQASLQGRQQLPADYYQEFLRVPYLTVLAGSLLAYRFHPQMLAAAASLGW